MRQMKNCLLKWVWVVISSLFFSCNQVEMNICFETDYVVLKIDSTGFLTSIYSKVDNIEYLSDKKSSPLLALYAGNDQVILPVSARQIDEKLMLTYVNGAEAIIEVGEKEEYLTFKLISLTNRGKTDHVVWGPYYTTIREYIGDLLGVVSNERCTIGMVACNDNTNTGLPTDGDIHCI